MVAIFGAATLGVGLVSASAQAPKFEKPARYRLTDDDRRAIEEAIQAIERVPVDRKLPHDVQAEVEVYHKAGVWALREGEFYTEKDVAMTLAVLKRGLERARELAEGRRPWAEARGSVIRAYRSKVDGSVQPYAVVVPADLDLNGPRLRLDVVLHGRGETLNEARFINQHDGKPAPADASGKITLHVFGRTNNAYRWAGETDVFEAIAAVKRNFKIDEERIVLRGFSMGGAGAWHLGLHHPSLWVSVEAGAGFSETKNYARLRNPSPTEEKLLHIYDAVDYAANAYNVPMVGYGGEDDPQRQASVNIEDALKALGYGMKTEGLITRGEGIDFLRVVGAKMGHRVDPASAQVLKEFHDTRAAKGLDLTPNRLKFVTYNLKYNEGAWVTIEQMEEHYRRASVEAEIVNQQVIVGKTENVAVLGVERHVGETIRFGTQEFPLEGAVKGLLPSVYFRREAEGWRQLSYEESRAIQENAERRKQHQMQGPIDDAFTGSFLCVRGTGTPWSPKVQKWADARLDQFARDWRRFMRGEIRIRNDTEVTPDDIENHNLILFGDPGSNRVLARVLKGLPVEWTEKELNLAGRFDASDHAPVLIAPNPLNVYHYVVVNSGHTFGAREFTGTNALLYPRLGDYAVFAVEDDKGPAKVSGLFDERWRLKADSETR
jgi:hypothetical protein